MYTQCTFTILYVGHRTRDHFLSAAVQSRGWHVYVPTALFEALGIYMFYDPDFVVIDATFVRSPLATEVCAHLRSVQAQHLLVVTDEHRQEQWQTAAVAVVRVLPSTTRTPDVVLAIVDLLESRITVHVTGRATVLVVKGSGRNLCAMVSDV